jgi:probable rRNA maturation factor
MLDDVPRRGSTRTTIVVDPPRRLRRTELEEFAESARRAAKLKGEVSILLTDSEAIRQLNRRYRHKNKPTDVLSFPSPAELQQHSAGDLAISVEIASEYAGKLGHSLTQELKILMLHGMLHLAGHDHENDNGEMAKLEARLRKRFTLPLSLTERNGALSQPPASTKSVSRNRRTGISSSADAPKRSSAAARATR